MVIEVLVAQRQPVDALRQHLGQRVLYPRRISRVGEAGDHALQQADLAGGLAQQQPAAVACHPGAVKLCHYLA